MKVQTRDIDLRHPLDGRLVPLRRYDPDGPPKGWVLFSVGYGGDRTGYAFLAKAWAQAGLTTFIIEHVGSNLEVLKSFPQKTREEINREVVRRVQESDELQARPRDLFLVWNSFREEFSQIPLGLGGHSYGTYTVLACAGLEPRSTNHGVEPISSRSLLIISPQPPDMLFQAKDYQTVATPTLVMTGTEDHLLGGEVDYGARLQVFRNLPPENRNLLVLEKVAHMTFAGIGIGLGKQLETIKTSTSLWWKETLQQDPPVEEWSDMILDVLSPNEVARCQ